MLQDAHGNFDGYVLAVIDPEYYQVIFSSVLNTPDSMISLVHESGKLIYRIPSIDGMEKVDLRSASNAAIWQFEASGKSLDFIKATLVTTATVRYMALAKLKPTTTQADHYLVTTISRDVAMVDARWFEDQIPSLTLLLALAMVSVIGLAMYQNRQTAFAHLRVDANAEKSKSDLALRQTHELLTMSEEAAGSGAWSWTIGNEQLNWSEQMFKLFGIDPATSEANFDTWRKLVHPDDLTGAEQSIADSLRDHKPFATAYRIIRPNGDIVWIDAYGNPTFDVDGKPLRFAGICVDATARHLAENQLRESEQRYRKISGELEALNADLEAKVGERTAALEAAMLTLEQFSRRDALTSLPNRLAADERLRGEFVSMKRSGAPYAVMMLDIDNFKKINDTFGHAVGDDVLRYTSKAMRTSLRENDFVCRYGGEEFLILLPATDLEEARGVAEKVRLAVVTVRVPVAGCNTISIGVALATPSDADEEVALKVADDRLYEAKRSGRNRVVHTS